MRLAWLARGRRDMIGAASRTGDENCAIVGFHYRHGHSWRIGALVQAAYTVRESQSVQARTAAPAASAVGTGDAPCMGLPARMQAGQHGSSGKAGWRDLRRAATAHGVWNLGTPAPAGASCVWYRYDTVLRGIEQVQRKYDGGYIFILFFCGKART